MNLTELIEECEQKYAEANQQMQKWAEARLRAEGALMALRTLKEQEGAPGSEQQAKGRETV